MKWKIISFLTSANLCPCLPPAAAAGRPGRPSGVVRCQSHAGELDWRVHRLLLRFQTQGESRLPSPLPHFVFIHHSCFLFNLSTFFYQVFPCFLLIPSPCFSSLSPRALIACFYFGDLCLSMYCYQNSVAKTYKSTLCLSWSSGSLICKWKSTETSLMIQKSYYPVHLEKDSVL